MIDGPTSSVPRQSIAYRNLILTPYTLAKLPRGAGSGAIKKAVEKAGVSEKWEQSGWAKKLAARQTRKVRSAARVVASGISRADDAQNASDFDRFQIQLAKKSRRDLVRKAYVKEKKAAA